MITLPVLFIFQNSGFSQGVFYWNINYGTKSNLLGGMVIGSVGDVTATYYNPGYLGLVEEPELIFGAKVYEYNDYRIETASIESEDSRAGKFTASPSFFAGSFKIDTVKTHKFYYSYLVREFAEVGFNFKNVLNEPNLANFESTTRSMNRKRSESWLGISWGFAPKKRVGLGVTTFAAIRNENFKVNDDRSSLNNTGSVTITQFSKEYKYYNIRLLAKFGVIWERSPLSLGFTLTTPSINVYGSGNSFVNIASSAQIQSDSSAIDGFFVSDYQKDLDSEYKNSVNLGFGCAYTFGRSKLHFSMEWFNEVPEYSILDPRPFVAQSTGDTVQNNVTIGLKSILNLGIGYELYINKNLSAFGSVYTDHNAINSFNQFDIFDPGMTIYHSTFGSNIKIGSAYLTTGIDFAYGSREFDSARSFSLDIDDQGLEEFIDNSKGRTQYFRIKALISASFRL